MSDRRWDRSRGASMKEFREPRKSVLALVTQASLAVVVDVTIENDGDERIWIPAA